MRFPHYVKMNITYIKMSSNENIHNLVIIYKISLAHLQIHITKLTLPYYQPQQTLPKKITISLMNIDANNFNIILAN